MKNKFYITTTLPYVNADPHIGFAMELIRADVIARFHRLEGEEVVFNTGTDEHGQKIYQKAQELNTSEQEYCDIKAEKYKKLKELLNISSTNFIRTTDPHHITAAKKFWQHCLDNGDIYKAKYQIKYCVGCELEKSESELTDGRCNIHPNLKLEIINEENYFFRWSKYQQPLLDLYDKNPNFVVPNFRLGEINKFVKAGLKDFSISRLKSKMPWGIEVPGDPAQVMYVWFDALINYISTLGWPKNQKKFSAFWPGIQIAGKDNLRQQSAMWQAMLMSAGLPPSKQIYIEGFITAEGQKMSKSLGNVVDPSKLVEKYGVDPVRYYLLREIPSYGDGDFSEKRFKEVFNADLANNLGNLISRVAKLCSLADFTDYKPETLNISENVQQYLNEFRFDEALKFINSKVDGLNKYLSEKKPWEKKGIDQTTTLIELTEGIRQVGLDLSPFLPDTARKISNQFAGPKITNSSPLFPRLQ